MFKLADGTKVQRDLYSSFLLYCCDTSDPKNLKIVTVELKYKQKLLDNTGRGRKLPARR